MITKYAVSRDDSIYHAWPDVVLTRGGKLVCIFSECTHHGDRSYTRIMLTDSSDRGRTWTPKRPLTEGTSKEKGYFYNCARLSGLRDGRLVALVDRVPHGPAGDDPERTNSAVNLLYFSSDEGRTWSPAVETPALGIVPDKLLELSTGRWLLPCHHKSPVTGKLVQRLWYSDNQGKTWQGPVIVGRHEDLNLCEVSILPLETEAGRVLVAFHRENSGQGWDCFKTLSHDDGLTWSEPIRFPLPACHRPVHDHLPLHAGRQGLGGELDAELLRGGNQCGIGAGAEARGRLDPHPAGRFRPFAQVRPGLFRLGPISGRRAVCGQLHRRRRAQGPDPRLQLPARGLRLPGLGSVLKQGGGGQVRKERRFSVARLALFSDEHDRPLFSDAA